METIYNSSNTATKAEEGTGLGFPASWYVLRPTVFGKKPKAVQLFGQALVAWRDNQGRPILMERYCSHMGASLAQGKVDSTGCIVCPFHAWRYDSRGQCVAIPAVKQIPKTAQQFVYPTVERYGFVWVWYGTPEPLFSLPHFPELEAERPRYMLKRYTVKTGTTLRRSMENGFDQRHLLYLHKTPANRVELNWLETLGAENLSNPKAWVGAEITLHMEKSYKGFLGSVMRILGYEENTIRLESWPSGLIVSVFFKGELWVRSMDMHTPVADGETTLEAAHLVRRTGKLWRDLLNYVLLALPAEFVVKEDVRLWKNMQPNAGRVFVHDDQGVIKFRKFYQDWLDQTQKLEVER